MHCLVQSLSDEEFIAKLSKTNKDKSVMLLTFNNTIYVNLSAMALV